MHQFQKRSNTIKHHQIADNLSGYFVGLALKGLNSYLAN